MLICMHSTSVRIDSTTHDELRRLAASSTPPSATPLRSRSRRSARTVSARTCPRRCETTRPPGSMPTSGDVSPRPRHTDWTGGRLPPPAIVVTAQRILDADPTVLQVVPLTSTIRRFHSEVEIEPDDTNGLAVASAAQCQHIRSIARERALHVAATSEQLCSHRSVRPSPLSSTCPDQTTDSSRPTHRQCQQSVASSETPPVFGHLTEEGQPFFVASQAHPDLSTRSGSSSGSCDRATSFSAVVTVNAAHRIGRGP